MTINNSNFAEFKCLKDTCIIKTSTQQANELQNSDKITFKKDTVLFGDYIAQENNHYQAIPAFERQNRPWYFYRNHWLFVPLNLKKLKECLPYGNPSKIDLFHAPLCKVWVRFQICTSVRLSFFLAQIAHESGSLRFTEELASGSAYEGRKDLGNLRPGDGMKYKGHGVIQLTGYDNHLRFTKFVNNLQPLDNSPEELALKTVDFVANPKLIATNPYYACLSAGWFWHSRNLNAIADQNTLSAFKKSTQIINGGFNGWSDRLQHWQHICKVLGVIPSS